MSALLTAGLIAGGTALGSAISGMFASKAQKKAQDTQAEENEKARQHDFDVMKYVNDYNTPSQQVERLRSAGLNPNLAYGSLQSSLATPVNSGASSALGASDANALSGLNNLGNALGQGYLGQQTTDVQKNVGQSQVDVNKATEGNIEAKTEGQKLENEKNSQLYGDEHWLDAMKKLPKAQLETLTTQKDINLKTIEEIVSRIGVNESQKALLMNNAHKAWAEYRYQTLYNQFAPSLLKIQQTQGIYSLFTAKKNLAVLDAQVGMYNALGEQAHAFAQKAIEEKNGITIDNLYKPANYRMQWRLNRSLLQLNEARVGLTNTINTLTDLGVDEKRLNIFVRENTMGAQIAQPYLNNFNSMMGLSSQFLDNTMKPFNTMSGFFGGNGAQASPSYLNSWNPSATW